MKVRLLREFGKTKKWLRVSGLGLLHFSTFGGHRRSSSTLDIKGSIPWGPDEPEGCEDGVF